MTSTATASAFPAVINLSADKPRVFAETAGLTIRTLREHPEYRFLTDSARGASDSWGVKSISLLAVKA